MRVEFLEEPELEFGAGQHVDIRHGLMDYGPLDVENEDMRFINVGIVGTPDTVEKLREWLERCRNEIPAKPSRQPNLFPAFPGFRSDIAFRSTFRFEERHLRRVRQREFDSLTKTGWSNMTVADAVRLFRSELDFLSEDRSVDVVLCAPPMSLIEAMDSADEEQQQLESGDHEEGTGTSFNFRRMLKAKAMQAIRVPIQIVLPTTYDPDRSRKRKTKPGKTVRIQDEATRAWNLHTALYYKANGTPWRLVRESSRLTACYVGISFFKSLDQENLMTSMAQVFDERGEGLIVRGGPVKVSKEDRQPHLSDEAGYRLLLDALDKYRREHFTAPARVVVHKTSRFSDAEKDGFLRAIDERGIASADLVSTRQSNNRLFRIGDYPPLRGTLLHLDDRSLSLYTRGSVAFYRTYPGMYVPRPLAVRCEDTEQTPSFLAREILALTKMNWNNTQFDGGDPITIRAADRVGDVLKYLENDDWVAPRYGFYM
jgi:hypothetical protein